MLALGATAITLFWLLEGLRESQRSERWPSASCSLTRLAPSNRWTTADGPGAMPPRVAPSRTSIGATDLATPRRTRRSALGSREVTSPLWDEGTQTGVIASYRHMAIVASFDGLSPMSP